jgi:hypothetical protein
VAGPAGAAATGQKLRSELVERIRRSDFFVPLLSRPYVTSDWCLREFETAAEARVPMRPLKISAEPLTPPPYLKDLYERMAGEPVFLDMHSRRAPARLRQMAEEMAGSRGEKRPEQASVNRPPRGGFAAGRSPATGPLLQGARVAAASTRPKAPAVTALQFPLGMVPKWTPRWSIAPAQSC